MVVSTLHGIYSYLRIYVDKDILFPANSNLGNQTVWSLKKKATLTNVFIRSFGFICNCLYFLSAIHGRSHRVSMMEAKVILQ